MLDDLLDIVAVAVVVAVVVVTIMINVSKYECRSKCENDGLLFHQSSLESCQCISERAIQVTE